MDTEVTWFAPPASVPLPLSQRPRLASWNRRDDPDQQALRAYLDHVEAVARPRLDEVGDPLAVGFDVRLDDGVDLLHERDLDNYALPVVTHLARSTGRAVRSVHVTKDHGATSSVQLETARPRSSAALAGSVHRVRTTASTDSSTYKEEIHGHLPDEDLLLPPGPVALEIAFVVGPGRVWTNLWKPTIDALGSLLGPSSPPRDWHPDDGRVVSLALHQRVDPTLGHDVVIALTAAPAGSADAAIRA